MTLLSYQDTVHKLCAQAGLKREKDFESETRINPNAVRYDVGLASPSKVCIFYIFFCHGTWFLVCFTFSRGGNFGVLSTWSVYSSIYGIIEGKNKANITGHHK